MNRIVGLETEYGCLTAEESGPAVIISRVRNWLFRKDRYGLADMHQRDWDEPAGNGGFLFNGGRAYLDMGHMEYCTPECRTLLDVLRYDQAGDDMLQHALCEMFLDRQSSFIRNNIDHYTGATFGCHENYLVRRSAPLTERNVLSLLTFLTLRVLYTGAGRVGATLGSEHRGDTRAAGADAHFQISQRADYINNDLFEWVQFNRAIINTRDEPLADSAKYRRLHLLHGDTSVLPVTLLLKVGTTALILDLLEEDRLPELALEDAVRSMRALSHHPDGPWDVVLLDGRTASAVSLLRQYQQAAQRAFAGRDEETDILLRIWESALMALDSRPEDLVGWVDWATKRWLIGQFVNSEKIKWDDPWLAAQDLEFHHVDRERNLARHLARIPREWDLDEELVVRARQEPPQDTRAHLRSRVMHRLKARRKPYFVDWEMVGAEGCEALHLMDPFDRGSAQAEAWIQNLEQPAAKPVIP